MITITPWHRLAQIYKEEIVSLSEIILIMMVSSAVGMVEGGPQSTFNLLDKTQLQDALVLSIIENSPAGDTITYRQLATYLKCHKQTVGGSVSRLIFRGVLTKDSHGSNGDTYAVVADIRSSIIVPAWLQHFAVALVELYSDQDIYTALIAEGRTAALRDMIQEYQKQSHLKYHPRSKDT